MSDSTEGKYQIWAAFAFFFFLKKSILLTSLFEYNFEKTIPQIYSFKVS